MTTFWINAGRLSAACPVKITKSAPVVTGNDDDNGFAGAGTVIGLLAVVPFWVVAYFLI